jgi:3-hydroxybutyryl-CoA dehydrogenase
LPSTIAIIGAGPLGRSLALRAARAGFRVFLEDVMPSNLHHAREFIRTELSAEGMAASLAATPPEKAIEPAQGSQASIEVKGTGFSPCIEGAKEKGASAPEGFIPVVFVSTVEDAVRTADLIIDCVPDELESKLEILWLLDRMAPPHAVFATPTTTQSIADLASCTYRPGKCIAIAAEPATLAECTGPTIQLRTAPATTPETIALVDQFWRALGLIPQFEAA